MSMEGSAVAAATGGTILLFIAYLVIQSAQSPYVNVPVLLFTLLGGFVGFLLLAFGMHGIIKSAVSAKNNAFHKD